MPPYRAELLLALALWPYGAWLSLYYLKGSIPSPGRRAKGGAPKWLIATPIIPLLLFGFCEVQAFRINRTEAWMWGLAACVVFVATRSWALGARSSVLRAWAMALPLSFSQRQACDELWAAFRAGRLLERDPLPQLTGQDRKNLLKYCTIEFRPELFGRNPKIYQARQAELVRKGYTDDQATVIAGMIFSMVGRAGKKC